MASPPIVGSPELSVGEVWRLILGHHIRHLPIVAEGRLVGVVSERDLFRAMPSMTELGEVGQIRATLETMTARHVMSPRTVLTCSPNDPLDYAAEVFATEKVGCLPVIDPGGAVVGVIVPSDCLRSLGMLGRRAVVRYSGGDKARGFIEVFLPEVRHLVLSSPDGARAMRIVPLEGAKAVLMVRSFQDDRERPDHCTWDSRRRTRPGVVLEFKDGERIFGYTIGPPKAGTRGFHVFPADAAGNLTRLYVFWDALRSVELVPVEDGSPEGAGAGDSAKNVPNTRRSAG